MKKFTFLLAAAAAAVIMLTACTAPVPPVGSVITVTDNGFSGDDEAWYYHVRGVEVIPSGVSARSCYPSGRDGAYSFVYDSIYRLKIDLEALIARGSDDGTYREYLERANAVVGAHLPTRLIPASDKTRAAGPDTSWAEAFVEYSDLYPDDALGNDELMSLFRFECTRMAREGMELMLKGHESLRGAVITPAPEVAGIRYDPALRRNVIDADIPDGVYVRATVGKKPATGCSGDYYVFAPGEPIALRVDIAEVTLAVVGKEGIVGDSVFCSTAESVHARRLSEETVTLESRLLDLGVRMLLDKSADDVLTYWDLCMVDTIWLSGDMLTLWGSDRSLSVSADTDFTVDDLDKFACLKAVSLTNHPIRKLEGNWIKYTDRIGLTACWIEDISAFRGSHVKSLTLVGNRITDGTVLESCLSLNGLYLGQNPLVRLRLPQRYIETLMLAGTGLESADFLDAVSGCSTLDIGGTKIADCTPVYRLCAGISSMTLPDRASAERVIGLYPEMRGRVKPTR